MFVFISGKFAYNFGVNKTGKIPSSQAPLVPRAIFAHEDCAPVTLPGMPFLDGDNSHSWLKVGAFSTMLKGN